MSVNLRVKPQGPYMARMKTRYSDALINRNTTTGKKHSGFESAYTNFEAKQDRLFRGVFEAQYEHLRNVYRKQWYEAYNANADEFLTKYNLTKAAQLASWEAEMEEQEAKRRQAFETTEGRAALSSKRMDLLRERRERGFFEFYERFMVRLQRMEKNVSFVEKSNLDAHIDKELDKYVMGEDGSPVNPASTATSSSDAGGDESKERRFPLNFVGQMPLLEDKDLNVVAVARHEYSHFKTRSPDSNAAMYTAPASDQITEDRLGAVSAQLHKLDLTPDMDDGVHSDDDAAALARSMEDVMDARAAEADDNRTPIDTISDEELAIQRQKSIEARSPRLSRMSFTKHKRDSDDIDIIPPSPSLNESREMSKKAQRAKNQEKNVRHAKEQRDSVDMALPGTEPKIGEVGKGGTKNIKRKKITEEQLETLAGMSKSVTSMSKAGGPSHAKKSTDANSNPATPKKGGKK